MILLSVVVHKLFALLQESASARGGRGNPQDLCDGPKTAERRGDVTARA